jgi:hypothetical protein
MQALRAGASAAVLTAVLAGCGGSETTQEPTPTQDAVQTSERDILNTVDRLQEAGRRGDGVAICREVFTARLARSIARAAGRPCAPTVRRTLFSPDTSISVQRDVRVTGQRATAVIREQNGHVSTLVLRREGGRWRIDSITPAGGG